MEQAPYRQNARAPSTHRTRTRIPLRMSVRRWLEAPRYVALGLLASVAIPYGELNGSFLAKYEMVAPRLETIENALAWVVLATLPTLALFLHRAWRRLPARHDEAPPSRAECAYAVRSIAAIGPFDCDAPTPRVELRERTIALVAGDDKDVGEWSRR